MNVTVQPSHGKLHSLLSGAASINHRRFGRREASRLSIVFIAISLFILVHRFLPLPRIFTLLNWSSSPFLVCLGQDEGDVDGDDAL